jgi:DNA-directed RNA polymerase subunit RPC12/RpoP
MARKKPVLEVKNVWCPYCKHQVFECSSDAYVCANCGATVRWNDDLNLWVPYEEPPIFTSKPETFPEGTEWVASPKGKYSAKRLYDPNTGEGTSDPKVLKALQDEQKKLEEQLEDVKRKIKIVLYR